MGAQLVAISSPQAAEMAKTSEVDSEIQRLTDRLIASERMALVGQATAQIAHHLTSQLNILPLIQLMEREYADDVQLAEFQILTRKDVDLGGRSTRRPACRRRAWGLCRLDHSGDLDGSTDEPRHLALVRSCQLVGLRCRAYRTGRSTSGRWCACRSHLGVNQDELVADADPCSCRATSSEVPRFPEVRFTLDATHHPDRLTR